MKARMDFFKRLEKAVQQSGQMVSWEDFKRMLSAFQAEEAQEKQGEQSEKR